jgi:ferritin-like metal-binding protein YciE
MRTGHELFVHGLNDMLDGEHQLIEALDENANDSSRPDLKKAFEQHRKETQGQIKRLEECFELLGEQSDRSECHGIRGLIVEKKAFVEEQPTDDLLDSLQRGRRDKGGKL